MKNIHKRTHGRIRRHDTGIRLIYENEECGQSIRSDVFDNEPFSERFCFVVGRSVVQMLSSRLVHGTLRAWRDGTHARYHDEQQSDVHSGKNKRTLMLPLKRWRISNSGVK